MISTITTTTVSIVTALSLAGSLAIVAILTLLALLIHKELTTASQKRTALILSRVLNIGIAPLLAVFAFIVAVKVIAALK